MTPSPASDSSRPASFWDGLFMPTRPAPQVDIRQQSLLMGFSLGLVVLTIVSAAVILLPPYFQDFRPLLSVFGGGAFIAYNLSYFLVRWGYYVPGSLVLILTVTIIPYGVVVFDPTQGDFQALLIFLSVMPLLANFLLSRQYAYMGMVLGSALLLILPLIGTGNNLAQLSVVFLMNTTVMMMAFLINEFTLWREADRRAELEALNDSLEQRVQDRTAELAAAKARAERSDHVKSAFLASMSHELRTPLNAIINFTGFVAEGDLGELNNEQQETLGQVVVSAKHLLALINDVLDMSKIEAGSLRLFVSDNVNLGDILAQTLKVGHTLLKGAHKEGQISLSANIPPDLPPLRGDRQRLLQILLNLMSNACKFTESGQIRLSAEARGDEILISLHDTGPGIPQADWPGIFEPFHQTASGLRQGGGTGLGMPISKNLTEAHGGRLWLESTPGQGSTFFVALPIKAEKLADSMMPPGVMK
jgi:signal transduction histidine kinase